MKTVALLFVLILNIYTEEVPLPQGPGVPIEQLGTQQLYANNYRDTTAWQMKNLSTDYEGQIEQIQQKPRIITERVTAPPKVLTQRVTTKPKYITERVEAPIKQRIITQPTVLNEYIKAEPQFVQGQERVVNAKPVYLPAKYENEVVERPVDIPGNTITNRTFVQPVSKTIREEVQIQNPDEVRKELQPVYRPVEEINNNKVNNVQVPANYVYRQDVYQPLVQREDVDLRILNSPSKVYNGELKTLPEKVEEYTTQKQVNVPGRTVTYQATRYPTVTNEKVQLQYQNTAPVYRNNPLREELPVVRIKSREVSSKVVHNVPEYTNVPVKVPMTHIVPEFRDVPVYFKLPEKKEDYMMNVREIESDIDRMLKEEGYEGWRGENLQGSGRGGRRGRRRRNYSSSDEDSCCSSEDGHDEYMRRKHEAKRWMKQQQERKEYMEWAKHHKQYKPAIDHLY